MSQTEVQLIKDAVIVNADISNSAAIDVSKISGAMPLTGGTFTNDVTFDGATAGRDILFDRSNNFLKFKDNAKISLGTDDDANIYYDGSNPIFYAGTNTLRIVADNIHLEAGDFGDEFLRCNHDGAVVLYFDNSAKFNTTTSGVAVTGELTIPDGSATGNRIAIGDSQDLALYHNGSNSFIADRGQGPLYIRGNNAVRIESWTSDASGEAMIIANSDGAVELYHNGSKELETTTDGIAVSSDNAVVNIVSSATGTSTAFVQFRGYRIVADVGRLGELQFINQRDGDVQAEIEVIANGDTNSYFDFKTNNAGLRTFRVQHDGTHIPDGLFAKFGNNNDMQMGHNTFNYITYTGASFQITGDSSNDIILRPKSDEFAAIFEPNAAAKLYYDNVLKFQTNSLGAKTLGRLEHQSADGNTSFRRDVYYLAIPTQTTKTITLSSLNGTGVFRAGGYTNAGQGALALHILFGGAMFATQHYQVNELINSGMQNTSISTSKNSTNYTIQITNSSTTFSLVLQIYLESTGTTMGYAVA